MTQTTLVWFRRDLRVYDHTALKTALSAGKPVIGMFVFDRDILAPLDKDDRRLTFIHQCLQSLKAQLANYAIPLWVSFGRPQEIIPQFAARFHAEEVVCAEDYEPAARERDRQVWRLLDEMGISLTSVTDQVVLPKATVMTQHGRPYSVFTPYKKSWLATYRYQPLWQPEDNREHIIRLQQSLPSMAQTPPEWPSLGTIGFQEQSLMREGGTEAAQKLLSDFLNRIDYYHVARDFPAKKGVSYLAPHLRFGTLSIRHLVQLAIEADSEGGQTWLSELIWREFYQQFLYHHPRVVNESWRPEYRSIQWDDSAHRLQKWQEGQTGYPIVDAAMRQLKHTGYMHNRLRMIVASFLCKDLLLDWRLGESWFAKQLLDFDLASNNGGWQWAAGTGCDAQPYFRVFNPIAQSQKFDPDGAFIRRYVPELAHLGKDVIHAPWLAKYSIDTHGYPEPIVDHAVQRKLAIERYRMAAEVYRNQQAE